MPNPNVLFYYLKGLAQSVENSKNEKHLVLDAMGSLGTYDARIVLMALAILQVEVGLGSGEARSRNSMESHHSQLSQLSEKARRVFAGQSDLSKRRVTERLARAMGSQVMGSQVSVSDLGDYQESETNSEIGSVFKAEKSDKDEGSKLEDKDDDPIILFSS